MTQMTQSFKKNDLSINFYTLFQIFETMKKPLNFTILEYDLEKNNSNYSEKSRTFSFDGKQWKIYQLKCTWETYYGSKEEKFIRLWCNNKEEQKLFLLDENNKITKAKQCDSLCGKMVQDVRGSTLCCQCSHYSAYSKKLLDGYRQQISQGSQFPQ